MFQRSTMLLLDEAPQAIAAAGVEVLLIDQTSSGGGTVADFLKLPFVTVCCALMLNLETSIPPFNTNWPYSPAWWAKLRNYLGYRLLAQIAQACVGLDAQLVIALGGGSNPASLPDLPGNPLVVGYAPQLELLQQATLTITHADMNTALLEFP